MQNAWQDPPDHGQYGGGPQLALPPMTPVTRWLLMANAVVWGASLVLWHLSGPLGRSLYTFFTLDPAAWRNWFPLIPVWQLVSYGFLHSVSDPLHLLFNLLWLYFFGTFLEGLIGSRRFLTTYMVAMVLGGLVQVLVFVAQGSSTPTVGASGAVMGVVIATATLRPNMRVLFLFVPLTLRTIALVKVGLDLFYLISGTGGSTAFVVHLVGAAWGFAAVRTGLIWRDPLEVLERRREQARREKEQDDAQRLDELLKRIHREGIGSLSQRDRAFLNRVSKRH